MAPQVFLDRPIVPECGRLLDLLFVWIITQGREPVSDSPVDLSVPQMPLTFRCRPAEEPADSLPGKAKRGNQAGDTGAKGPTGAPSYEADPGSGDSEHDDQPDPEPPRDLPGGLPELARDTVGSCDVVAQPQAVFARNFASQHFTPLLSLTKQILRALVAASDQRCPPQPQRVVGGMSGVRRKPRRERDQQRMHLAGRLFD